MSSITIKTKLDSNIINLGKQARSLIGKSVEIVIRELTPRPFEKKWRGIGAADLGKKMDHINIREFAHDD